MRIPIEEKSLEDLDKAIAAYERAGGEMHDIACCEAWCVAFHWLHANFAKDIDDPTKDDAWYAEYQAGLKMVVERLK